MRSSSDIPHDIGAERAPPPQLVATDPEAAASISVLISILGKLRARGNLLFPLEFSAYEAAANAKRQAIHLGFTGEQNYCSKLKDCKACFGTVCWPSFISVVESKS